MGRSRLLFLLGMLVAALTWGGPAEAAKRKPKPSGARKSKARAARRKGATPIAPAQPEDYGPPAPVPVPLERAAGTCVSYEPGRYLIVAEVDERGRVFWIDEKTLVEMPDLRLGDRVRVLWLPGRDGPAARRVLPGPTATPRS